LDRKFSRNGGGVGVRRSAGGTAPEITGGRSEEEGGGVEGEEGSESFTG
jgi:hypothetical protein